MQTAIATAPTMLPDYPLYCYETTPRVVPKVGEKWRWVQFRHDVVAEHEDDRKKWCADWYAKRQASARGIQSP
ncbi:hypothetical protein [Rhizobium phage RHEph19]|nr:hypothetical protein [Rhizobium phage RHEph19]